MKHDFPHNPSWPIPVGTQVVTRVDVREVGGKVMFPAGAVGVVVHSPADATHVYRVKFPDGYEATLARDALVLLKEHKAGPLASGAEGSVNLYDHVIYRCIVGSLAFGLDHDASDTDRRGIYLPPAELHWSLYGVPEQLENEATQEAYWELQKFLVMALKANPNVLECLWSPLVETATPLAEELLGMRDMFLSKLVYQTFNGYVLSQFKKLATDLRLHGAPKWKHVMHLLRLLQSGITVLREAYVPVHVVEQRDHLLAIRRGEVAWEEVEAWRKSLHAEFDAAYQATRLPERPDYERANAFLIKARRAAFSDR
jgi:predicted nucleotidyltransferase